jgi:hypothetical protein
MVKAETSVSTDLPSTPSRSRNVFWLLTFPTRAPIEFEITQLMLIPLGATFCKLVALITPFLTSTVLAKTLRKVFATPLEGIERMALAPETSLAIWMVIRGTEGVGLGKARAEPARASVDATTEVLILMVGMVVGCLSGD